MSTKHLLKSVTTLMLLCLFAACYGPKKARKQVVKAQVNYPAVLAKICADAYPVRIIDSTRTEYLPGQVVTKTDTVTAECPPNAAGEVVRVKVPCPPSSYRVDTVQTVQFRQVENTAKVKALEAERDDAKAETIKTQERGDRLEKGRNTWRVIGLGSMALIAVAVVLKAKKVLPV